MVHILEVEPKYLWRDKTSRRSVPKKVRLGSKNQARESISQYIRTVLKVSDWLIQILGTVTRKVL